MEWGWQGVFLAELLYLEKPGELIAGGISKNVTTMLVDNVVWAKSGNHAQKGKLSEVQQSTGR